MIIKNHRSLMIQIRSHFKKTTHSRHVCVFVKQFSILDKHNFIFRSASITMLHNSN